MGTTDVNVGQDVADEYHERVQDVIAPVAVAVVAAEPLRIQRHPSREFTTGSASVVPLAIPVQVIGANPFRERLLITNRGTATVFVGPERDTLTPSGGWPLAAGRELELHTRKAIYVVADPAAVETAPVHFLAEHVDG
jgi:hypothetical protein